MGINKHCVIVSGGLYASFDRIWDADFIIGCDKGYAYLQKCGIRPHLFVGDRDSVGMPIDGDIPRLDLPVEKDDTDTLAAVRYAVEQGYSSIDVYCALGGRIDHEFANMQTAIFAVRAGVRISLYGRDNECHFLSNETRIFKKREGWSISVFSFTERCEGVYEKGVHFPLENATLDFGFPLGVSNSFEGDAEISVAEGILMVMLSRLDKS